MTVSCVFPRFRNLREKCSALGTPSASKFSHQAISFSPAKVRSPGHLFWLTRPIFDCFYVDFCWILAPSWGVQGGPTNQLFGDLLALGAKIAPRDPQEPPKSLPRASKTLPRGPWGEIFGRFLIVFKVLLNEVCRTVQLSFMESPANVWLAIDMPGQCSVDLLSFSGTWSACCSFFPTSASGHMLACLEQVFI